MSNEKLSIEQIIEKIDIYKEKLSVMPRNNPKNVIKYLEELQNIKAEYTNYRTELLEEMKKRYDKQIVAKSDKKISILEEKKELLENLIYLLNDTKTSYEKMELDKIIFKLSKFYKENLENMNLVILSAIEKFKKVGIKLTPDDFNYTIYVKEYMETFLEELEKGDINTVVVKNKFDDIYWKCPEILTHIQLNIRHIFLKKEKLIDKNYVRIKQDMLKKLGVNSKKLLSDYEEVVKELDERKEKNQSIILSNFLSGKIKAKDYTDEKLMEYCEKIIYKDVLDKEELYGSKLEENINELLHTMYEYKNYLKFKFIVDDIKKRYSDKDKYKNVYKATKKEICVKEKKLNKMNKKIASKRMFRQKNRLEEKNVVYNQIITEIKELYKKLDEDRLCNSIFKEINDNSTIKDILIFATSFYTNLVECVYKKLDASQEETEQFIYELQHFVENPYTKIIDNITFLEEKDIGMIISDRYRLLNFKVSKEDFVEENIDTMLEVVSKIKQGYNIKKSGLTIEKIEEICNLKDILQKIN